MPLSTALYTGVSGLNADGSGLSVVGNNISNSNTIGFKGGVASFSDILSSSMSGGSQIGRGVNLQGVLGDFSQGTLQTTNNPLDMAIQGDGFFIVHTAATGGAQYYTRAGQFSLNKDGNIVDPNGNYLQGYLLGPGQGGVLGTINVSSLNSPPKETDSVTMSANLNSATGVNTTTGLFTEDPTTDQTFTIGNSNNGIQISTDGGVTYNTVSITAGPYTGPGLATALQTQLETIDPGATVKYIPPTGTAPYKFAIYNAFAIDGNNNTLNFSVAGTSYTATIGIANYANGAALAAAIQTAMNNANPPGLPANSFTVNYNAATKLFDIQNNNTASAVTLNWGSSTILPQELGLTAVQTNIAANTGLLSAAGFPSTHPTDGVDSASGLPSTHPTDGVHSADGAPTSLTISGANDTLIFTDGLGNTVTATLSHNGGVAYSLAGLAAEVQTEMNAAENTQLGTAGINYYQADGGVTVPGNITITNLTGSNVTLDQAGDNATANLGFSGVSGYGVPAATWAVTAANNNNKIVFTDGQGNTVTATIADNAAYTPATLAAAVQTAMNTAENTKLGTVGVTYYTADAVTAPGRITIKNLTGLPVTLHQAGDTASTGIGFTVYNVPAATWAITLANTNNKIIFSDGLGHNVTATIADNAAYTLAGLATEIQNEMNVAENTQLGTAGITYYQADATTAPGKITITNLTGSAVTLHQAGDNASPGLGFTVYAVPANSSNQTGATAIAGTTALTFDWENAKSTAASMLGFSQCDIVGGGLRLKYTVTVGTATAITTSDFQAAGFDPTNGSNTSDFSTSLTVYDSLGNSHLINVYFKKVAQDTSIGAGNYATNGNRWLYWAVTPAGDSITAQAQISAEGLLEFDSGGKLIDDNGGKAAMSSFNFTGGVAQNQSVPFNFGKAIADGGSGLTGTTQFGSPNSVLFQDQDGYSSGSLQSLSVDQTGTMTGTFTNGQTSKVAQVALARFIAETQLQKQGNNLFSESSASGGAIIGTANTSGRGQISSSSLEASNIDLAAEFVDMITIQRGYEANAKVITVTSQLLQTLGQIITA
ncbi:MAG: flagellar hook-basal body complex protein [Nitrospirae bacterium]|nr:flagellar hook-basal body complex protein [Nitrospirota bacterium]